MSGYFSCGIFDSENVFENIKETKERVCSFWEIEYIISGKGTSYVDGKAFQREKNMLIVARPGQKRKSVLHFKCYFLHLDIPEDSRFYLSAINLPCYLYPIEQNEFAGIFENLIRYCSAKKFPYENEVVQAELTKLFYFLNETAIQNSARSPAINASSARLINYVTNYINENLDKNLSLRALSDATFYSPSYLRGIFKQTLGISPHQYVDSKRIKKAKTMLSNPNIPISDVAFGCGFSSQSYFCYTFKRN